MGTRITERRLVIGLLDRNWKAYRRKLLCSNWGAVLVFAWWYWEIPGVL